MENCPKVYSTNEGRIIVLSQSTSALGRVHIVKINLHAFHTTEIYGDIRFTLHPFDPDE
jgi:hypothetical protein